MRQRGQQQCGGSRLNYRAARNFKCIWSTGFCIGIMLVHDCSMFAKSMRAVWKTSGLRPDVFRPPAGRHPAYGHVSFGRFITMGVEVLITTNNRNVLCFEGLISMRDKNADT